MRSTSRLSCSVVGWSLVAITSSFYFGYYLTRRPWQSNSSSVYRGRTFIAYSPPDSPTERLTTDESSTDKSVYRQVAHVVY